jgi:hypothetical protein
LLAPRDDSSNAEISAALARAGLKLGEEMQAFIDIE